MKIHEEAPQGVYLEGAIEFITYAGNITTYTIDVDGKPVLVEEQNASHSAKFKAGVKVYLSWEEEHCLLMEENV